MALMSCHSPRKSSATQKSVGDRGERMYGDMEVGVEDEDSGVECSLEDIEKMERMDAWSKTLVAVKVLTEFKKRRKKTLEAEKAKKERRKNLWRRLRLKLRIFNLFANKISSDDPAVDRILKLKRKLGDVTIESEEDAYRYQIKIEDSFQKQLGFRLKTGDIIMTHFDTILTNNNKKQKGRRKSKIFERTHSYDEMSLGGMARRGGRVRLSRLLLDPDTASASVLRRQSWHSETIAEARSVTDLARHYYSGGPGGWRPSPIVIVSTPEPRPAPSLGLVSLAMVPGHDTPHKHYVQTRPCIVSRNLKKIFRK